MPVTLILPLEVTLIVLVMLVLLSVRLLELDIVRSLPLAETGPPNWLFERLTMIEFPVAVRFERPVTAIFVPETCVMPPPAEMIRKFVLEILPRIVALLL